MARIQDYLPNKEETTTVQVRMPAKDVREVKKKMKEDGLVWKELLHACFKSYLDYDLDRNKGDVREKLDFKYQMK